MTTGTPALHTTALRAPLLWACAAVACGIAVADLSGAPAWLAALALSLSLASLWAALRRAGGVFLAALAVLATLGAWAATANELPRPPTLGCQGAETVWRARVSTIFGRRVRSAARGLERDVALELVGQRCGPVYAPAAGRVRTALFGGPPLASGDLVEAKLEVSPIAAARNPTQPDPRILARRDRLGGRAVARSPYVVAEFAAGWRATLDRARDEVASLIEAHLEPAQAAVAKALATGDQSSISAELRAVWADAGLAHILSVSGLHLTLIATVIFWLLYRLLALLPGVAERFSLRRGAALLTIAPTVLFCLWVGAPAAAVRATIMTTAAFTAIVLGRPAAVPNALGLAGSAILLFAPASLYDPGFLLSFVAVAFLLTLPRTGPSSSRPGRLWRAVRTLILTSVLATAATLPISAYYFGRVSLIAPLANLLGVPLGSVVATPLALAYGALAPLGEGLEAALREPLSRSLWALNGLAEIAASVPLAAVDLPRPNAVAIASYYALLLAVLLARGKPRRRLATASALVIVTTLCAQGLALRQQGALRLTLPYVGQGDAVLVELPQGGAALIDAGGASSPGGLDPGIAVLAPLLRQKGIRALDLAVVTHPHPDHLEGFAYLARHVPIRELWWNGEGGELTSMRELVKSVRAAGGKVALAAELPATLWREGVRIDVLHPRPALADGRTYPELDTNDNSIVLRLSYGARSALLPGDVGAEAEAMLAPLLSPTDVVKLGHHGSRTSSSLPFLTKLAPQLALIACGDHNYFGMPHAEVVARLAQLGVPALRTDEDGMLILTTDGREWRVQTYRGRVIRLAGRLLTEGPRSRESRQ